jgi:hypothetical protein
VITFDCGGTKTIKLTSELKPPKTKDTVIDGGGNITLDGQMMTRILHFDGGDYRKTTTTLTVQHITFTNAKVTGTPIPQAPPPCSQGYELDGGGAAILINDGMLHVIDVSFLGNQAAPLGPDVAGGGVYATGSLGVVVVGSRFVGNTASNGAAIGSLNSDLQVYDTTFSQNHALGNGANSISSMCTVNGGEVGDGGNGGAISIDGGSDGTVTICGATFGSNTSGALGGAIFRTPDNAKQTTNVDRSTFDSNTAVQGGGAMYFHNSTLTITASTISNNSAPGAGGIQADGSTFDFTNVTFAANAATASLGGGFSLFGGDGKLVNCTFADNTANAGSGKFGAAIAGGTTLEIDNTVFSNNLSMDCGAPMACQDGTSTGAADLQWPQNHVVCMNADPPCAGGGATTFADAMLGALADNGGSTQTMMPKTGSPAIGIGKACPATDQRGNPRKTPDGCTAGAVEAP